MDESNIYMLGLDAKGLVFGARQLSVSYLKLKLIQFGPYYGYNGMNIIDL